MRQLLAATVRFLDRLQALGLLAIRATLGVIMVAHGYPKVFGGLQRHVQTVAGLGLPSWWAYLSAAAEFFGGLLVIAGVATRFCAFAILINMGVAIWKVHWKNGLVGRGGYEFPLALATMALALIFFGAGPLSLGAVLKRGGAERKTQPK